MANIFGIFPVDLKTWKFSWKSSKSVYAFINIAGGLLICAVSCLQQIMTKPTSAKVCKKIHS